ncbi:hypothetical protein [Geodermatophilus sp. DSM 45219]|uniref:hypothetical protein n=1 Tax=Geodermatophilus sp. DSM 45219 TaxID=1881103 RepID=UPI0008839DFE|nr:hypothetical protein [Geodermatophilus sp. DSM 45219]SDN69437.1 hypothetical protein SAMN05428965_1183 [Geodermatophilus sp. DSM 45219]
MSPRAEPGHRRPRWVTVTLAAAVFLVLLLAVLWALGVEHGPGRHLSSSAPQAAPVLPVPVGR